MITSTSPWLDYANVIKSHPYVYGNPMCADSINWISSVRFKKKTVADVLNTYKEEVPNEWAKWAIEETWNEVDGSVHLLLIGLLKSEMTAFNFYIHKTDLTTNEEQALINLYKGKLPMAERQLANGEIIPIR